VALLKRELDVDPLPETAEQVAFLLGVGGDEGLEGRSENPAQAAVPQLVVVSSQGRLKGPR